MTNSVKNRVQYFVFDLFLLGTPVFADQVQDLAQDCAKEQIKAHSGMAKPLSEKDFQPYCACISKVFADNLTNSQMNELKMNGLDKKPSWFKGAQGSAEKACMVDDSKMRA